MGERTVSHYRILEKLGEGGMGAVYLAQDLHLHRRVAIKFPSPSEDEQSQSLFVREARLASSLSNPHIATIFDFGETEDHKPFIVMELVEGESLARMMSDGPLALHKCIPIMLAIADALDHAHRHGVIHRDIKPANVVLGPQGSIKVLDFGLAKRLPTPDSGHQGDLTGDLTATNRDVMRGTPRYMSPEQIRGHEIDGRSDIFAFGIVFYEALTGRPLFSGSNTFEILSAILHVQPDPPSTLNRSVTPSVDRIVMKCLARDKTLRYASAAALIADLKTLELESSLEGTRPLSESGKSKRDFTLPDSAGMETVISESIREEVPGSLSTVTISRSKVLRKKPVLIGAILTFVVIASAALIYFAVGRGTGSTKRSAEAQQYFDQGLFALRDGAYLKARSVLERAVKVDDSWSLAHARLAESWIELDNLDAASREITAAHARVTKDKAIGKLDSLYLQAITQVADGNYAEAEKSYIEIAEREPSEPYVHFDLGRAYERNRKIKEAISEYLKATELNPAFAASHLRLGILYARTGDIESAEQRFKTAESIYETSMNGEGKTEVIFQRGLAYLNTRKFAQSRDQFQKALSRAQGEAPNSYQAIRSRLQLSSVAASENNLEEAERLAGEGFEIANREGIEYLTMRSRISLGEVYFRQNKLTEALRYTEDARKLAERYRMQRHVMLAQLNLGSIRIYQNLNDEGLTLVQPALEFFKGLGFKTQTNAAQLLIARATRNKGDYTSALKMFNEVGAKDEIAMMKLETEQYPEAVSAFEESVKQSKADGDKESELFNQINLARALSMLGYLSRADEALRRATSLASNDDLKAALLSPSAEMALIRRDFAVAARLGKERLARTDPEDYPERLLGLQWLCRSEPARCDEALQVAMRMSNPSRLARTRLIVAESLVGQNKSTEAIPSARSSSEEFERLGLGDSWWRALSIAATASSKSGDAPGAIDLAKRAKASLELLKTRWPAIDYNSYLSRPDVAWERSQLDKLAGTK